MGKIIYNTTKDCTRGNQYQQIRKLKTTNNTLNVVNKNVIAVSPKQYQYTNSNGKRKCVIIIFQKSFFTIIIYKFNTLIRWGKGCGHFLRLT